MANPPRTFTPKALARTLDEAFLEPLPPINQKSGLGEKVTSSNAETNTTSPPRLWLDRSITEYTAPAEVALAKEQVREVTVQNCMPALERTLKIECEPDVIRPAALYLLHPVHMALTALHPDITILCMSEPYENRKIRPDIVYKKGDTIFAILEYKVPGAMKKPQFDRAKAPWDTSKEDIASLKSSASTLKDNTRFGEDAATLMKQLTRYVNEVGTTKYAALFSWEALFLSVYDREDNELIYGTFIPRNGVNRNKLRKAYLGWLMEALENRGQSRLDPPGGRYTDQDAISRTQRRGPGGGSGDAGSGPSEGGPGGPVTRSKSGDNGSGNSGARPEPPKQGTSGHAGKTAAAAHPRNSSPIPHKTARPANPTATATLPVRHAHGVKAAAQQHPAPVTQSRQPLQELKNTHTSSPRQPPKPQSLPMKDATHQAPRVQPAKVAEPAARKKVDVPHPLKRASPLKK